MLSVQSDTDTQSSTLTKRNHIFLSLMLAYVKPTCGTVPVVQHSGSIISITMKVKSGGRHSLALNLLHSKQEQLKEGTVSNKQHLTLSSPWGELCWFIWASVLPEQQQCDLHPLQRNNRLGHILSKYCCVMWAAGSEIVHMRKYIQETGISLTK